MLELKKGESDVDKSGPPWTASWSTEALGAPGAQKSLGIDQQSPPLTREPTQCVFFFSSPAWFCGDDPPHVE